MALPTQRVRHSFRRQALVVGVLVVIAGLFTLKYDQSRRPGRLLAAEPEKTWDGRKERPIASAAMTLATIDFEVKNDGGTSVRILETKSNCGCGKPRLSTEVVLPGETAVVHLDAIVPDIGEKDALCYLRTNSPETPTVNFRLHLIGARKPPFIIQADGDLTFLGEFGETEIREILVHTVEAEGELSHPSITNPAPFLRVLEPTITEKPYGEPGLVHKTYRFEVRRSKEPLPEHFREEVWVNDPWKESLKLPVMISYEPGSRLKAIPERLILPRITDGAAQAEFLVVSRTPSDKLHAEVSADHSPFSVERLTISADQRRTTFRVTDREGAKASARFGEILITDGNDPKVSLLVKVKLDEAQMP